jgi:hypothetical protein
MGWDNSRRGKERELGVGATMESEVWSIIGVNWSWRTEDPNCQVERVNSCVSFTKQQVLDVGLLIVFLTTSSLEFPAARFLVNRARETLIKK